MGKVRRAGEPAPMIWRRLGNWSLVGPGQRDLIGAGLLLASGVSILALISPAGAVGSLWHAQLHFLFGAGAYVAPLLFAGLGLALLRPRFSPAYTFRRRVVVGWLVLFALFESVLQALSGDVEVGVGSGGSPWTVLAPGEGAGGIVGWLLRLALVGLVGPVGAWLLTLLGALVSVVLILELTPASLLRLGIAGIANARAALRDRFFPRFTVRKREVALPKEEVAPARPRKLVAPTAGGRAGAGAPSGSGTGAAATPEGTTGPVPGGAPVLARPGGGRPVDGWVLPSVSLLQHGVAGELSQTDINRKVKQIEQTLADFDVPARVVEVNPGPTVTQFGIEPGFREKRDRGGNIIRRDKVKVSEILSLTNDLALALAAPAIRIEAPVPGRHVVGIEVPNNTTTVVSLRQLIESTAFQRLLTKARLPIALGEDVAGQPIVADLAKAPHLLIAGATGSGKSACINSLITCLLLHTTPDEMRLLLVDPKRVELTGYNDVPHLLRPVVVDVDKVVGVLKWAVHEMGERYKRFEQTGVRNIEAYNKRVAGEATAPSEPGAPSGPEPLPYIVIVIDELADLMMLAPDDVERLICRLAQLARATGIHLVVATQRPSVDVITGLIKANFPTRISFAVTSQVDSRTILDTTGAEKLLGKGDMLYLPTDAAKPLRLQGTWVDDAEIEGVVRGWREQGRPQFVEQLVNVQSGDDDDDEGDELYEKAVALAEQHERVSASLLQRRLRVGYTRAARLVEMLEQNGVIGPAEGGKSREVLRRAEAPSAEEPEEEPEPVEVQMEGRY